MYIHGRQRAQNSSAARESPGEEWLGDGSAIRLVDIFADTGTSSSQRLVRKESRPRMRDLLTRLAPRDRELLVMYYVEELSVAEIGSALALTEGAVKTRYLRALERVRSLVEGEQERSN